MLMRDIKKAGEKARVLFSSTLNHSWLFCTTVHKWLQKVLTSCAYSGICECLWVDGTDKFVGLPPLPPPRRQIIPAQLPTPGLPPPNVLKGEILEVISRVPSKPVKQFLRRWKGRQGINAKRDARNRARIYTDIEFLPFRLEFRVLQ